MFGYIRPYKAELKCKDFDLYRATYCGLCRRLRQRHGWLAPLFLTYDFTFLAMLLWDSEESFKPCFGRCYANPFCKKAMCSDSPVLDLAADESVILTYWKVRDSVRDEHGLKVILAKGLAVLLTPSYQKAAKLRSDFDHAVQKNLSELERLEQERCTSLDRSADAFAQILSAAVPESNEQSRILKQLLYHIGRWIYLIDARDDLEEDQAEGRYNPILLRYNGVLDDAALSLTMSQSLELAGAALQLGEYGCRRPILENILYLGLPRIQRAVFDGSWAKIKKQKIWRQNQ